MIDWSNFNGFFTTGIPAIVLYPSFVVTAIMILLGLLWKSVKNKKIYTLWVLLIEYVFIVVSSTIICRKKAAFEFDRLELTPFWTYKAVIEHTPGVRVWDIVLNIALFLPLGILLKLLSPSLSLQKMLLIALLFSVSLETNQYIFEKGVAQIDDVMHNVIGALLGWSLAYGILSLDNRKVTR